MAACTVISDTTWLCLDRGGARNAEKGAGMSKKEHGDCGYEFDTVGLCDTCAKPV